MSETQDDIRRLANLLMVGHGGALLVIFNARAQHSLTFDGLKNIAWFFAIGLVAAFLLAYIAYRHTINETQSVVVGDNRQRTQQAARLDWMGGCFAVSAGAFVIGLLLAIGSLESERPTEPQVHTAPQAPSVESPTSPPAPTDESLGDQSIPATEDAAPAKSG